MSIKVEIEWIERNKRYMTVEVDSIEELSDFKPILREGKEHWSKLENNEPYSAKPKALNKYVFPDPFSPYAIFTPLSKSMQCFPLNGPKFASSIFLIFNFYTFR